MINWRALIKAVATVISGFLALLFFGLLIASFDALYGVFMVSAAIFASVLAVHLVYLEFCSKEDN